MIERERLRVSPSQIKRWDQCPRLTAWQLNTDVKRTPDPLPRANDLGTRCHSIAEAWLRDGTPPDDGEVFRYWRSVKKLDRSAPGWSIDGQAVNWESASLAAESGQWVDEAVDARPGSIVAAGIHLLPAPRTPGLELETESTFRTKVSTYMARADLRRPGQIGDHKFVRDLGSALSATPGKLNSYGEPNHIGDDPQFLIQAAAEFVADPALQEFEGSWYYYQTKAKGGRFPVRKVALRVLREPTGEAMLGIERKAALIQEVYRTGIHPLLLPVPKSCDAYGRPCERWNDCKPTDLERYQGLMTTNVDDRVASILRDFVPQIIPADGGPPPPPPPPPPPEAIPAPGVTLIHGLPYETWIRMDIPARDAHVAALALPEGHPLKGPDVINPPEAPAQGYGPVAAPKRVDPVTIPAGGLEAMTRDELKALAIERGILTSSSRLGAPAILALLTKGLPPALPPADPSPLDVPPPPPPAEIDQVLALRDTAVTAIRACLDDLNRIQDRLHALLGI